LGDPRFTQSFSASASVCSRVGDSLVLVTVGLPFGRFASTPVSGERARSNKRGSGVEGVPERPGVVDGHSKPTYSDRARKTCAFPGTAVESDVFFEQHTTEKPASAGVQVPHHPDPLSHAGCRRPTGAA
jgi:hypothetical protein